MTKTVRLIQLRRALRTLREAEASPETWPDALKSIMDALHVSGAACIFFNKQTGRVDWACFSGLSAGLTDRYVDHYAALDPFSPVVNAEPGWQRLLASLPPAAIAGSEWYNDFVRRCGVEDIVASRVAETTSHFCIVGLHQAAGHGADDLDAGVLERLTAPLAAASLKRMTELLPGTDVPAPAVLPLAEANRYFFHVWNGRYYVDAAGNHFVTPEEACAYAAKIASELRREPGWNAFSILVVDDSGRLVAARLWNDAVPPDGEPTAGTRPCCAQ